MMVPRFAHVIHEPAHQAYQCASAIFHSTDPTEQAAFSTLTCQHVADGTLWRATTSATRSAAAVLQRRGVVESVPGLPDAYILTAFGIQVASAFTLLCLDADP